MTALDPAPILEQLRRERETMGVYLTATVDRLIATTERTGELALPFPRGGRALAPSPTPRVPGVLSFAALCDRARPDAPGLAALRCGELAGHEPSEHVAYGQGDRVLARWSSVAPAFRRRSALISTADHDDHERRTERAR